MFYVVLIPFFTPTSFTFHFNELQLKKELNVLEKNRFSKKQRASQNHVQSF